jgi:hypothetical protein
MLRRSVEVFHYYMSETTTASPTYCSAGYLEVMGSGDYLDVSVQIDRVTGTGGFDLFIEHSADGVYFATANSQPVVAGNGDASFAAGTLSTTATNYAVARAGYKFPLLAFVRLRLSLTTAATRANVYAIAQIRDREKDHANARRGPAEHLRQTPKPDAAQRRAIAMGQIDTAVQNIKKQIKRATDGGK